MFASYIRSKKSLFDCEVARQYPPEEWLTLRIPTTARDIVEALDGAIAKTGQSHARAAGPLVRIFFIKRDEMVMILNSPSLARCEGIYAQLDRYSLASNESILQSYSTAGVMSELSTLILQDEVQFVRGGLPHSADESREVVEKYLTRCPPDKHLLLRPFLPYLRTRYEADAIWGNRSNILMRHIRRDTARQIAQGGKTHLGANGAELEMFTDTCRAIVFNLVQDSYWPMPDEMQTDLDRMRADPEMPGAGWTRFPLIAFPDEITAALSIGDELRLAGMAEA